MINRDRMVAELLDCIRIPSPSFCERQFADHVKQVLAELGLSCQEDKAGRAIGGNCGNLFARLPGDKKYPPLLLCAHLDTVETGEGIIPKVKNGMLASSGSTILGTDDKAGVVAILETLRIIKEQNLRTPPLEIVFTVAEEQGLLGAKQFDCKKLKAQAGFILDATGPVGGVINRAPAYEAINASITGRAAHAGAAPEEGISAIQIAAQAISHMKLGRIDEKTTANIGMISGGTARNVVPEQCALKGEARSHSSAALQRQVQHMLLCLHQAVAAHGGTMDVELERQFEAFYAPANSLPVQRVKKAVQQIGVPFYTKSTGGGADTAVFAAAGIPCVSLCNGYEEPHSIHEHMPLEQLHLLGKLTLSLVIQDI